MIKCGKRKCNDFYLYLFEDQDLQLEEQKTLYRKLDEHEIEKEKFNIGMKLELASIPPNQLSINIKLGLSIVEDAAKE